ncbi:sensor histidine kinase [Mycolicibacterium hodleri]|uniref:sensor histidine kinase n=1 Tax=Mycolicibacterium hodleri TaxID=49897 RepID=UPI003D161C4E
MPVSIHVDVEGRLPESIEVAAYYVVAEALTNAAKHSQASGVAIRVTLAADALDIEVADDGVGGATSEAGGSGLVGLRDRVEAVSGRLAVSSPPGEGTTLTARIPRTASADPAGGQPA